MNIHPLWSIYIIILILLTGLTSCSRDEDQPETYRVPTSNVQKSASKTKEQNADRAIKLLAELEKLDATRTIPDWAYDSRWYYVDIPRFHNGDRSNDPKGTLPWTADWPMLQGSYQRPHDDDPEIRREQFSQWYQHARKEIANHHYGGDLQGLTKRLPYLKSLGVNTLYLGKILFRTHNIELDHYHHIDDSIGIRDSAKLLRGETTNPATWKFSETDKLFLKFLEVAHEQGMRVIISGYDFIPKKLNNPTPNEVKQVMAVTRRWMDPDGNGNPSDGVDGWVPEMTLYLHTGLPSQWQKKVQELNPDSLIVKSKLGSMRNFSFYRDIITLITNDLHHKLLTSITTADSKKQIAFAWKFDRIVEQIQKHALDDFTSMFDHPSQRKLTDMDLPELLPTYDGKPTLGAYDRWKLATIMQHFLPGVPITYYGDEVGMYGGPTHENARRPMWWNDLPDPKSKSPDYRGDFFALIQWLHKTRAKYAPLRRGDFKFVMMDDVKKIFAFSRSYKGEKVILVMNIGSEKQLVMLPAGKSGQIVATLSPRLTPRPTHGSKTVDYTKIKTMHVGGVRQFVNKEGRVRVWVNPMSVRVVIVNQE